MSRNSRQRAEHVENIKMSLTLKHNPYIKQSRWIIVIPFITLLTGCNIENGVHKSLDLLYGETNRKSLEELQEEYEQTHNFEAVREGNRINGENYLYVYSLLKNPNPSKKDKEKISRTMTSYLEVQGDEFDRNAKINALSSDINNSFKTARSLIEEENFSSKFYRMVQLGEYDFERGGFPISNKFVNYEVKISSQFSSAALSSSRILVSGERFIGRNATKRMRAAITFDLSSNKINFIPVEKSNARDFKKAFLQKDSFVMLYAKATSTSQIPLGEQSPLDKLASPIPGSEGMRLGSGNMPSIDMTVYRIDIFKMENKTAVRIGGISHKSS